jgi:hypothetical protein
VQLRDNVPQNERTEIDAAISWVGVWNPDIWTDKSFRQAVETVRDHLWLSRWGIRPVTHAITLFNITVGGGLSNPQLEFLSAVHPNFVPRPDKNGLFIFSADDSSGRQEWEIERDPGGFSRIRIASGINGDGDFLSSTIDGDLVDLYNVDDKSGRQRWIIEDAAGDLKHIRVYKGVSGNVRYLSASQDGNHLSLAEADDGSGLQRWRIRPIE